MAGFKAWAIGLLAGSLALQGWMLSRQSRIRAELSQLQEQTNNQNSRFIQSFNQLEAAVREGNSFPDWLTKPATMLTPAPACGESQVKVTWSLQEWTSGTVAHLQYRRGTGEKWQEAQVKDLGLQSYEASFPIAGGPGLLWKLQVIRKRPQPGTNPGYVYYPPNSEQSSSGQPAMPAFQYRIVADTPGGSRATPPQALTLGPDQTSAASFSVSVGEQGEYTVTAAVDPSPANPCVQIESVTARPFAGDNRIGEYPLAPTGKTPGVLSAVFRSDAVLTRIDLAVRYGGLERTVPVDLSSK